MSKRTALVWGQSAHAGQTGTRNRRQRARFATMVESLEVRQLLSIPAAPTNLNATPNDERQIDLTWTDNSNNEVGFLVERSPNGSTGWTQVGSTSANDNTYTDGDLAECTRYYYRVRAYDENPVHYSTYSNVDSEWTNPIRPEDLVALISPTRADLTWTDYSQMETAYTVERYVNGTWQGALTIPANSTSYTFYGAYSQGNAYAFRVRSMYAPANNRTSWACYTSAAPANVNVLTVSESEMDISWVDKSSDEAQFDVQRSLNGSSGWESVGFFPANTTSVRDDGLSECTTYYYRVFSVHTTKGRAAFTWSPSPYVNQDVTNPNRPTGLVVEVSPSQASLTWVDNSQHETGYRVERYVDGSWLGMLNIAANSTSYVFNDTFSQDHDYAFRVRSSYVRASHADYTPVLASYVTATAVGDDQIQVSWTDNTDNEDPDVIADYVGENHFLLQRSTNGSTWTDLPPLLPDTTSATDAGIAEGTTYYYRLWAVHNRGGMGRFNWPTVVATTVPAEPSNLVAAATRGGTIELTWDDNSASETGFSVYRKETDNPLSDFVLAGSVGANAEYFENVGLEEMTNYTFYVVANSSAGSSAHSNEATDMTLLRKPLDLAARRISDTQVNFTWVDQSQQEEAYYIAKSINYDPSTGTGDWTTIWDGPASSTSAEVTVSTTPETQYYFKVWCDRASDPVDWSNAYIIGSSFPYAPSNLVATPVSSSQIDISWTDNSNGEMGYLIERSDNGVDGWTLVGSVGWDVTTYSDTGLSAGTTYYYRVVTHSPYADSLCDGSVSAATLS